jgi:dihydropteroate synthase
MFLSGRIQIFRPDMSRFPARLLHIATRAEAERELVSIGVDTCGIAMMAPKMLSHCVKLTGLQCRQANILKQEMLSLGGDAAVARGTVACSIDSTDVILVGTHKQLHKLCAKLSPQPFALPAIARELKTVLEHAVSPPALWRTSQRALSLERPLIMGILNVTPDSFSDGDLFLSPQKAFDRALEMADEGADIIDIGGESTRPGAPPVSAEVELRRILPVIEGLSGKLSCPVSVDTWKSSVAASALSAGAEIINDISGLNFDPQMPETVAKSGAGIVLMHTGGTPQTMQNQTDYTDLIGNITQALSISCDRACEAGVERDHIAIDPGIGFGKESGQNLEILRRLDEFSSLGFPVLIGTSRKSFIGKTLSREAGERLHGTSATVAMAVANGARIIRVHDIKAMRDVVDMTHAIRSGFTYTTSGPEGMGT